MDNTNRALKIRREIKDIEFTLDNAPLMDGEIFDLMDKKIELEKELELLQVET